MADDSWDAHRAEIQQLYIQDKRTLKYIAEFMSSKGFRKTKSQYETQFKKWGLRKKQTVPRNVNWDFIAKRVEKRKRLHEKESEVVIFKERIPPEKVRKLQYGKAFVSTVDMISGYGAPSPKTPEGIVVRTPLCPDANLDLQAWCQSLRVTWNLSLPCLQFARLLRSDRNQDSLSISSREISFQSAAAKVKLIKRLGLVARSPLSLDVDINSRISTLLGILMPEEYEGQHQALQTSCVSIELYLLSNGLVPKAIPLDDGTKENDERYLKVLGDAGWCTVNHFKVLLRSQKPTAQAFVEKIFASAARQFHTNIVEMILKAGMHADCIIEGFGQKTPLKWASQQTDNRAVKLIELLLSNGANINQSKHGQSVLLSAIHISDKAVIKTLLRHNAVVDLKCLVGNAAQNDADLFKRLFERYIERDIQIYQQVSIYYYPGYQTTILGAAVISGSAENTQMVLQTFPSLVTAGENPHQPEYISPLSIAVRLRPNETIVKMLIEAGTDINVPDCDGRTPLEHALAVGNSNACGFLLENGARIRSLSYDDLRTLAGAIAMGRDPDQVIAGLIQQSARLSPNFREWSEPVLASAIAKGDWTVIHLLQQAGTKVPTGKVSRIKDKDTAHYLNAMGLLDAILYENGPDILLHAIFNCKYDLARWLINHEPGLLDQKLYSDHTPLCAASRRADLSFVQFILSCGAGVTDYALANAIYRLQEDGDDSLFRLMISHFQGSAPTAFALAAFRGNLDLLKFLFSIGIVPKGTPHPDFDEIREYVYQPQSVPEVAVCSGNRLAFDILTQSHFWEPNLLGRALVVAAALSEEEFVASILQLNPNMNEETILADRRPGILLLHNYVTFTALQIAVRMQNVRIVRMLLGIADTDVNYPAKDPFGCTALQHAVENGDMVLVILLLQHEADVNYPANDVFGRTSLQHAMENGDLGLIILLLKHGADVNSLPTKNRGATALQLAAIKGYLPIAGRLLELGADVNAAGAVIQGRTALEGAAEHGRIDMVHMLLDKGASISGTAGGEQYENAVRLARGNGHYAVARMLESHKRDAEQIPGLSSELFGDGAREVFDVDEYLIL